QVPPPQWHRLCGCERSTIDPVRGQHLFDLSARMRGRILATRLGQQGCIMEWLQRFAVVFAMFFIASSAEAAISFSVSFDDPNGTLASVRSQVESHVIAAGERWASYLSGDAAIEVVVKSMNDVTYAEGRSVTSNFVRSSGDLTIYEQGMTAEIRTGVDPNDGAPDVEIDLNPFYATSELWFDPDPRSRTAPVDIEHTDAMSTFIHEFGHALGFNGWMNPILGTYPGDARSTFDEHTTFAGLNFAFTGAEAMAVYGGPVPLTLGSTSHLGNFALLPGADLQLELMNGLFFYRGSRYDVSPIDLAILRDVGVPIKIATGDFNQDGLVDAADYVVWRKRLGTTYLPNDYNAWRAHFGDTGSGGASVGATAAVPEPTMLVVLAAAMLAFYSGRAIR
ncbi:MAG: hypothetical protein ABIU95_05595, partial [Burkholderiales bacterium]